MPATRDPASEWLDRPARTLLARAYEHRGEWQSVRLADPSRARLAEAAIEGIDLQAPDRPSAAGGKNLDCKSRWMRAYVRAIYYQHKWYSATRRSAREGWWRERRLEPRHAGAIEIRVGRRAGARGVIPAGRMISIRYVTGGRTALRKVQAQPRSARIYDNAGETAARYSMIEKREWNAWG